MHFITRSIVISVLGLLPLQVIIGASPVDLKHKTLSFLQSPRFYAYSKTASSFANYEKISSSADFNNTLHIRMKQKYDGVPVWNGDFIIHQPAKNNSKLNLLANDKNSRLSGMIYQDLAVDLGLPPKDKRDNVMINEATQLYQAKIKQSVTIKSNKTFLMVYVDSKNKAHWAYYVELFLKTSKGNIAQPVYILDFNTREVYETWNNLHTLENNLEFVPAGGYGGNEKIGIALYDNSTRYAPAFSILRDKEKAICYLKGSASINQLLDNEAAYFEVLNAEKFPNGPSTPVQYACQQTSKEHGNIYWNDGLDFLADNNAFFHANIVNEMYLSWYSTPVVTLGLTENGDLLPIRLNTHQHLQANNAFWLSLNKEMYFGDGEEDKYYPLTSIDIVAHELSHGFTEQNSNLTYKGQSGGLNESYSDMAAVAAGYFLKKESVWKIGTDITQTADALRYLDNPRYDCVGKVPYSKLGVRLCSIDHIKDYKDGVVSMGDQTINELPFVDVHFSSGIFNKVFYLMAQGFGGDKQEGTRKAFNVMVQANRGYWTPNTTFAAAACGVLEATHDYGYDKSVVVKAMTAVGIDTTKC